MPSCWSTDWHQDNHKRVCSIQRNATNSVNGMNIPISLLCGIYPLVTYLVLSFRLVAEHLLVKFYTKYANELSLVVGKDESNNNLRYSWLLKHWLSRNHDFHIRNSDSRKEADHHGCSFQGAGLRQHGLFYDRMYSCPLNTRRFNRRMNPRNKGNMSI